MICCAGVHRPLGDKSVAAAEPLANNADDFGPSEIEKRINRSTDTSAIFDIMERHGGRFNPLNISNAFHRLAKNLGFFTETRPKWHVGLTVRQEKTCKTIFHRAVSILDEFDPTSLSTFVWAWAALSVPSSDLKAGMDAIMTKAMAKIKSFRAQELSDFVWGIATLNLNPIVSGLLIGIRDVAVLVISDFTPQYLSKLMYAFAKLDMRNCGELTKCSAQRAIATMQDFKPLNMSQLMWAYAKLDLSPGKELYQAILRKAEASIDDFNRQTQYSANLLWSLDKLGVDVPLPLAEALSGRRNSTTFQPRRPPTSKMEPAGPRIRSNSKEGDSKHAFFRNDNIRKESSEAIMRHYIPSHVEDRMPSFDSRSGPQRSSGPSQRDWEATKSNHYLSDPKLGGDRSSFAEHSLKRKLEDFSDRDVRNSVEEYVERPRKKFETFFGNVERMRDAAGHDAAGHLHGLSGAGDSVPIQTTCICTHSNDLYHPSKTILTHLLTTTIYVRLLAA
jgi:hypothetical protein